MKKLFSFFLIVPFIGYLFNNIQHSKNEISNINDIPISYDARLLNEVTPVRDQGDTNLCWAYSSINAIETSLLHNKTIDDNSALILSPTSLAYHRFKRNSDPLGNTNGDYQEINYLQSSGSPSYCATLLSQWCGPVNVSTPANQDAFLSNEFRFEESIHIKTDDLNLQDSIKKIKEAIIEYGAVTFSYYNARETYYYNSKVDKLDGVSHAVTIIGWDDNIKADSFVPGAATQDGAWLIKNSYSSLPYFYLSYDNTSSNIFAFKLANLRKYDFNYFYDSSLDDGLSFSINAKTASNIYQAKKGDADNDEYINAINIGIQGLNSTVKVEIYTDVQDTSDPRSGIKKLEQEQIFEDEGYRLLKLNTPVKINKNSFYSVIVSISNEENNAIILVSPGSGMSYKYNGNYWTKLGGYISYVARIKAFTSLVNNEKIDINNAEVNMENDNFIYSSAPIIPKIFLFFKNELLEENKDYELTYLNNINAGKATILVKGIDEYYGEKIIYFDIEKKDKPDCPINNIIISNNEKFLKDISLPNNYIWKNPDSLIQNKAIIIYIGKDKDNYFDNEFEISIIKQISSSNSSLPSTSSSTNIISSSTSFISSSNSISSSFTQPNDTSSSLSSSNLSISSNSQSSTSTSSQQNTSPSIDSKILIIILISGIISITAIFSIVIIITFKKGK